MKYIILSIIILLIITAVILFLRYRNSKEEIEETNESFFSQEDKERLSFQRSQIKIDFLKDHFLKIIEKVEKSYYILNSEGISNLYINDLLKEKIHSDIQSERNNGIEKQLKDFVLVSDKFKSYQDNRIMYAVSKIKVEVPFFVDYNYYHVTTGNTHIIKYYTKTFEFENIKNNWYLSSIQREEIKNTNNYYEYLEEKKNYKNTFN